MPIPKALKKMVVPVAEVDFINSVDIFYFKDKKGRITGKIDFTQKIIEGDYFKGFKKRK